MSKNNELVALIHPGQPQSQREQLILRSEARQLKSENKGYFVDSGRVFQLTTVDLFAHWEENTGRGNLVPFGRIFNKMLKPPTINYPIPACGAKNPPTVSILQMYTPSPEGAW